MTEGTHGEISKESGSEEETHGSCEDDGREARGCEEGRHRAETASISPKGSAPHAACGRTSISARL
jgi:hypothetical protein